MENAAKLVHSLTVKSRKGLAHDVTDSCATHAGPVHGIIGTSLPDYIFIRSQTFKRRFVTKLSVYRLKTVVTVLLRNSGDN